MRVAHVDFDIGVADRLMTLRAERGYTYRKLGKLTGLSYRTLMHYENCNFGMCAYSAVKIAKALGCSVGWLLTGEDGA